MYDSATRITIRERLQGVKRCVTLATLITVGVWSVGMSGDWIMNARLLRGWNYVVAEVRTIMHVVSIERIRLYIFPHC